MYLITNGQIITEDALLTGYDLLVQDDMIAKIAKQGELKPVAAMQVIDAAGGYITPGFIDIHSDYIEHMTAPRPTSLMDFNMSIREAEKELITHGITTMFHSLSFYKYTEFTHNPIRNPDNVRRFIDLIDKAQSKAQRHLMRHRFHARFEIDNLDETDNLKTFIAEKKVHLVSFMDHTPGQGQYTDLKKYRDIVKGYKNLEDEEIEEIVLRHQTKAKLTAEAMKEIADLALVHGIAIASHDDDCTEKLELVGSLGATISEFPITLETAHQAKKQGMFTMAGAPNILLGGSHSGNLSAAEAIRADCIDILCSDYYPPSLLHAVFKLQQMYELNLVDILRLVTINPAKAVNMDTQVGSVKEGKKADLLIIEMMDSEYPVITSVIVDGKLVQKTNYIALTGK